MDGLTMDERELLVAKLRASGAAELIAGADLIEAQLLRIEALKASISGIHVDELISLIRAIADGPFGKLNPEKMVNAEAEIMNSLKNSSEPIALAAIDELEILKNRNRDLAAIQSKQLQEKIDILRSKPITESEEAHDA